MQESANVVDRLAAITVGVDSYFWGYTVWPEGAGFLFNVVEGNSVQWGVRRAPLAPLTSAC